MFEHFLPYISVDRVTVHGKQFKSLTSMQGDSAHLLIFLCIDSCWSALTEHRKLDRAGLGSMCLPFSCDLCAGGLHKQSSHSCQYSVHCLQSPVAFPSNSLSVTVQYYLKSFGTLTMKICNETSTYTDLLSRILHNIHRTLGKQGGQLA